ncbi:MAG: type II toxin-antitoxin system prevent-host-death family antitoxin [Boseongicola sp. SB0675_bin_26]|nr:type II toxin-antitoxin system prevent-host-death family antitoxin [Boseongicola sp. SB0675_bin_26]
MSRPRLRFFPVRSPRAGAGGQLNVRHQGHRVPRSRKIDRPKGNPESRPLAIVADPYAVDMDSRTDRPMGPVSREVAGMPRHRRLEAEALSRPKTERNHSAQDSPATPRRWSNPARQAIVTELMHQGVMRTIRLREGKATFSGLLEGAAKGDTAAITRSGQPPAALVGVDKRNRLGQTPSFGRLLAASGIEEGNVSPRDTSPAQDAKPLGHRFTWWARTPS